jgi:hypothetical protein
METGREVAISYTIPTDVAPRERVLVQSFRRPGMRPMRSPRIGVDPAVNVIRRGHIKSSVKFGLYPDWSGVVARISPAHTHLCWSLGLGPIDLLAEPT